MTETITKKRENLGNTDNQLEKQDYVEVMEKSVLYY